MTKEEKQKLLGQILSRKHHAHPIVSFHALDQGLVDTLSEIIIDLSRILDQVHTDGVEAGCAIGWFKKL